MPAGLPLGLSEPAHRCGPDLLHAAVVRDGGTPPVQQAQRFPSRPDPFSLLPFLQIFTFLFMGGKLERIEIHALSSSDQGQAEERRGVESLKEQFATFDAAKARCFLEEDRERLLAVIETGFGDFKDFNKRVRTAFAQHRHHPSWCKHKGLGHAVKVGPPAPRGACGPAP